MKICVLISCMYQEDFSIIEKSNVQTDVVVINQCNNNNIQEFFFKNKQGKKCFAKVISTTEKGLSRSRNMAIQNSWGDILYMCDDDELLVDNYEDLIIDAYNQNPSKDIITFSLIRENHKYPEKAGSIGIFQILRTSSVQTTFKRKQIIDKGVSFDEKMGSGSGNGGGEENKFLMDCRRSGLKLYYVPSIIAIVKSEDSRWFKGFNEKYFKDTFWAARRILGTPLGLSYMFYWCFFRSRHFDIDMSKFSMLKYSIRGFFEKR